MRYKKMIEKLDDKEMEKEMDDEHPGDFDRGTEFLTKRTIKHHKLFLEEFNKKILNDSTKFFSYKKIKDFKVKNDILSFTSPIKNPLKVNETTYAKIWKAEHSKKAMIVVPHRCATEDDYTELCESLQTIGFNVIKLIMPYHERRKPSTRKNAKHMVSPNVGLTINVVRQATIEVRALIDWLETQDIEEIGIIGSSIGSCIAFLASIHDARIKASIFIHMSSYFGDVVYTGKSTRHIKKVMQHSLSKEEARVLRGVISPINYIHRLAGTLPNHYIICGTFDTTFHYTLTKDVFREYKTYDVPCKKTILPIGHFTIGHFPIKYYLGRCIIKYILQHIGDAFQSARAKKISSYIIPKVKFSKEDL